MIKQNTVLSISAAFVLTMSFIGSAAAQNAASEESKAAFKTIAKRLDMYGDLLVVANTDGAIEKLFDQVLGAAKLSSGPEVAETLATLNKIKDYLKKNGFYAVNGFGMSVVPRDDGLHKTSSFVARDSSAASLPLWRGLVGGVQREMKCHSFLPADTVLIRSSTADIKKLWQLVQSGVMELGSEKGKQSFNQSMQMMPMVLGMPIDELMAGLGDEGFISIQFSKTKTTDIPVGGMGSSQTVTIQEPSVLFAIEIAGNSIPELLKKRMGTPQKPMESIQVAGSTVFVSPMPLPAPIPVKPAFAVKESILLLGSSPDVVSSALKAESTKKGLFTESEFKKIFGDLPTKNNGMIYVSKRLTDNIAKLQQATIKNAKPGPGGQNPMAGMLETLQKTQSSGTMAAVTLNWKHGVQVKGVSSSSGKEAVLSMAVAPAGIAAAIAIPAFLQYRTDTRSGLCKNNCRLIDHAKGVWAIKNSKAAGDPVDKAGIVAYIKGGMPRCPQGGTYTIGNVDEPTQCSVHDKP